MANRIRCAFCDYVMDLPASLAKKADAQGRIEWMCEGCGSPIVLDAASSDALTTNPPAPVASGPQPTAAAKPSRPSKPSLLPPPLPNGATRSTISPPPQISAPVRRVPPPPPPPPLPGGARMTLPPPPPLPARAQPPQPPAIPPIVQALAASPATTQEQHAGARVSGVHPTAHAESRTLPHGAPSPTPTPTVAPLLFEANDAMGVLPPHPELGAPPKPSTEGASRPSRESTGEVTQRSLQVPRWVAGSMMVAALGVLALGGVLVHQGLITFKSSGTAKAPAPTQGAATQNAMRPAGEQAAPGRVVAAAFSDAAPNAASSAASPPSAAAAPRASTGLAWPLPQKDEAKKDDAKASESAPSKDEATKENRSEESAASSSSSASDEKPASATADKSAEAKQGEEAKAIEGDQSATSEEAAPPGPPAPPFDKAAAAVALGAAQARAQTCRKSTEAAGLVRVAVTFAPSGRATNAVLSGAFAGTDTGSCIASSFRGASVPAFTGPMVTVSKTVAID